MQNMFLMHFACKNNQKMFRSKIITVFFTLEEIYMLDNDKNSYIRVELAKSVTVDVSWFIIDIKL